MTRRFGVTVYFATHELLGSGYRLLQTGYSLVRACTSGFWLGLLAPESLLEIDRLYYSRHDRYRDDSYNRAGLWAWEAAVIEKYFRGRERVLVVGAGGGRELLALRRMGFAADGVECNEVLVDAANDLLAREGFGGSVRFAPPDSCPAGGQTYEGLIIGWGAYMLIQGRRKRVELLRDMRAQSSPTAPVLLSFFCRPPGARRFQLICAIANSLRRVTGRERVELGDDLEPEYVHYFDRAEIESELTEAGFELALYRTEPYGHAVGVPRG